MTSATEHNEFHRLVGQIKSLLGDSGIDTDDAVEKIKEVMKIYQSSRKEWATYALEDGKKAYTRNLVEDCSEKVNILILVWNPGKGSAIHDHADAHCIMKVLEGTLQEDLYHWPEEPDRPLDLKNKTKYGENAVTYISDKVGLHSISNPGTEVAVSLHIYTPPWAENCHSFNPQTGEKKDIQPSCYDSKNGGIVTCSK
ncbi:hypothetical protein RUND412_003306 [Rhizina undulata]